MEKFSEILAKDLIKLALQTGALKLQGPGMASSEEEAKKCGERDAMYLLTLLNELQKAPAQ